MPMEEEEYKIDNSSSAGNMEGWVGAEYKYHYIVFIWCYGYKEGGGEELLPSEALGEGVPELGLRRGRLGEDGGLE